MFYSILDISETDPHADRVYAKLRQLRVTHTVFATCVVIESHSKAALEAFIQLLSETISIYASPVFNATDVVRIISVNKHFIEYMRNVNNISFVYNKDTTMIRGEFEDMKNAIIAYGNVSWFHSITHAHVA